MLPATARLRRRTEFQTTVRRGRRAGSGTLVVHLLLPTREQQGGIGPGGASREPSPGTRVGFVVSRAVGGAVVRNLVRRRLRHLIRERLADLPVGAQIVVRAQPTAANRSYRGLGADFDAACRAALRTPRRRSSTGRR